MRGLTPISRDADQLGTLLTSAKNLQTEWDSHPARYFSGLSVQEIGVKYFMLGHTVRALQENCATEADIAWLNRHIQHARDKKPKVRVDIIITHGSNKED